MACVAPPHLSSSARDLTAPSLKPSQTEEINKAAALIVLPACIQTTGAQDPR